MGKDDYLAREVGKKAVRPSFGSARQKAKGIRGLEKSHEQDQTVYSNCHGRVESHR